MINFDVVVRHLDGYEKWYRYKMMMALPFFSLLGINIYIYELIAFIPAQICCHEKCLSKQNCPYETKDDFNSTCQSDFPGYENQPESSMVMEWSLVCDYAWLRALPYSSIMLGELLGCTLTGHFSDLYGRRRLFMVGVFGLLICWILLLLIPIGASWGFPFFVLIRIPMGVFSNFLYSSGMTMLMEYSDPQRRASCNAWIDIFCALGGIYLPILSKYSKFKNWRELVFFSFAPYLLLTGFFLKIPESPKWLISKGKFNKVIKIFESLHDNELNFDKWDHFDQKDEMESVSLKDLFNHFGTIVVVMSGSFICGFGFYFGITFFSSALGSDPHFNVLILSLMEIPGILLVRFLQDNIGRKFTLIFSLVLGSVCLFISGFQKRDSYLLLLFSSLAKFFGTVLYAVMYTMTSEIYPTTLRAKAYGFQEFVAGLTSSLFPYFFALGDIVPGLPQLIFSGLAINTAILANKYLIETKGLVMPNSIEEAKMALNNDLLDLFPH